MISRGLWSITALTLVFTASCKPADKGAAAGEPASMGSAQAASEDPSSTPSIARIASGSKDHTTLVAALKAVNWLDALANPGPFTVFAPTNEAFDKLPPGTVETLLKPENAAQLKTILLHHVLVSAYSESDLTDGLSLPMFDGGPATVSRQGDKISIDGANVIATVRASNGTLYIVDAVLLPKAKE
jgi:uncharacterized surface protein with fasciclin (FAS1) repeats